MNVITKEKVVSFIDKLGFFFFAVLVFFLPISNAAIESSFGFIFLLFIIRFGFIFGLFIMQIIVDRPTFTAIKFLFKNRIITAIKVFLKNRINLAVLIFYIAIGLSLFVSPLVLKSFKAWFFKWGEGVLLFYFAQVFLNKNRVKVLLRVMFCSAFLVCVSGMYQKLAGVDFIRGFEVMNTAEITGAVRSTFNHYNDFASFLIIIFFIAYVFLFSLKKLSTRLILGFLLLLVITNFFFTYSRGGWISFIIISLLLMIFAAKNRYRLFFLGPVIIFLVIIFSVTSLRERFFFIFGESGDADRFRIWRLALAMWKDSPLLGKGLGLFMDDFSKYSSKLYAIYLHVQYAHNCYLQILAETGVVGLITFLWILKEVIVRGYRKLRQSFDYILLGLLAGFSAYSIHIFFDTQLYSLKLAILFWILLAFISIYLSQQVSEKECKPKNAEIPNL